MSSPSIHSLHYLPTLDPDSGGVRSYVLDLLELLNREGHATTLVTPEAFGHRTVTGDAHRGDHRLHEITERADPLGRFPTSAIERIFDEPGGTPDLLHLHGMWSPPNLQLAAAARRRGIPYIVTIHGMLDTWCLRKSRLRKKVFLAVGGSKWLDRAACIVSTAQGEVDQTRQHYPRTPVEIIPAPMDLSAYATLPGPTPAEEAFGPSGTGDLASDRPNVLFLSRVHPKKGLEILIESVRLLRDRGRPVRLLVAGGPPGPYKDRMEALAVRHDVADDVRFLGSVTGDLKRSLFQRADLFALATHQENFGIVFTESLACETPVLTTKGVDIWPELESSGGAVIADRTTEAFADAIDGVVADAGKAAAMGISGRSWVMDYLDVDTITRRFLEVYRQVISDGRASGRTDT